jgi:hypothetical protein
MSEMVDRVAYAMGTYMVEEMADGTFAIMNGYRDTIVRADLTAADEPLDLCDDMNARAAIAAMREPTDTMAAAGEAAMGREGAHDCEVAAHDIYQAMIDAAL